LTAEQIIASLVEMNLADGLRNIPAGTPSSNDVTILADSANDLGESGFSGNPLASDADTFAADVGHYFGVNDPIFAANGNYSVDTSYASAVESDIRTLMADCPQAARDATGTMDG
jgi:hypothetical protein